MIRVFLLLGLLFSAAISALCFGSVTLTPAEVFNVLLKGEGDPLFQIIAGIRLPRVLLAMVVGASLSVSGTVFQAVLKNPLADPYLIGVSGGAAFGAAAAIVLRAPPYLIPAAAFAGALLAVTAVFMISYRLNLGGAGFILAGVSLGFIFSSAVFLMYAFAKPEQVHQAVMWMMGDLSAARYDLLIPLGSASLAFGAAAVFFSRSLDIISFGERMYKSAGIGLFPVAAVYWIAALLAAISVSLCGVVGFIGLIAPHAMRLFIGPGHSRLIPSAAVAGSIFLLVSDTIARSAFPPYEIPAGVVSGLAGGIFFLAYMLRRGG